MCASADNPYPGSRAFTEADQGRFFGRVPDREIGLDLWKTGRLTVLSGPPGCGKTSLLQAGLRPELRKKTNRPYILPTGNLAHGLAFPAPALAEHNPFTLALLRSWAPDDLPTRLAGLTVSDWLRGFTRNVSGTVYAAVDGLSVLALSPRASGAWRAWRQDFLTGLARAIDDFPRLHLLLLTSDEERDLLSAAVGGGARHTLRALSPDAALAAIAGPAELAGRPFTGQATTVLAVDLQDGGAVAPALLQAACSRLWDRLPAGTAEISEEALGGVSGTDTALADWCGQAVTEAAALHRVAPEGLLSELTGPVASVSDVVLEALLDRHLLTREAGKYRLASGRLARPLRQARPGPARVSAVAHLRAGELALARGDLPVARAQAGRARDLRLEDQLRDAEEFRERADAESLLGNVAYRSGDPGQAIPHHRTASKLMQTAGDSHAAAYQLAAVGQLLLAGDEPGAAIASLNAAAHRERSDLTLWIQLAAALWQTGNSRWAVETLDSVLHREGGHVKARRLRGEILADLDAGPAALRDLDRVARREAGPGLPSARAARALALAQTGDHAAAFREIESALDDARRSGLVLFYAARVAELAGDTASVKEWATEAIDAKNPPLSRPHRRKALALAGYGDRRRSGPGLVPGLS